MSEYTFADLIINPETPNLESLVGKEVYFNDVPAHCIRNANDDYMVGILMGIHIWESAPFYVETPSGLLLNYACIIPKKESFLAKKEESEPEYVPFENAEEFLDAYCHNETKKLDGIYHYLATRGVWLEDKGENAYYMVAEIWDDGVVLGDNKMETTKASSGKYFTINSTTEWDELFENYAFLDGSPCGKLIEAEHE